MWVNRCIRSPIDMARMECSTLFQNLVTYLQAHMQLLTYTVSKVRLNQYSFHWIQVFFCVPQNNNNTRVNKWWPSSVLSNYLMWNEKMWILWFIFSILYCSQCIGKIIMLHCNNCLVSWYRNLNRVCDSYKETRVSVMKTLMFYLVLISLNMLMIPTVRHWTIIYIY